MQAVFYALAGINHFWHADNYNSFMPSWMPLPFELIYITGFLEIGLGLLLIPATTRKFAGWLIIALLIAVYPANIQMAINYVSTHNPHTWIALARLPIQFVLIWWAWIYTKTGK